MRDYDVIIEIRSIHKIPHTFAFCLFAMVVVWEFRYGMEWNGSCRHVRYGRDNAVEWVRGYVCVCGVSVEVPSQTLLISKEEQKKRKGMVI